MTDVLKPHKPRPYWHVDFKWICGILLFFTLGVCLLLYNLSSLTERERAVTISSTIVASLFSREGLDDDKGLEEFRQKAAATAGDTVMPVENLPWLKISKQDALTLSPRELRIKIFRNLTEPIYDKGLKGAAAEFTSDPGEQEKFTKNATIFGAFTKTAHQAFQKFFIITAFLSALLLAGLVYFSSGWGRAVSPAIVLLGITPLGALISVLLLNPPRDGDAPFAKIPEGIAREIGGSLSRSYLLAFLTAIALLLSALIGKLIHKKAQAKKTTAEPKKLTAD